MTNCDSIKCPKCKGNGKIRLSKPYQKCAAAIGKLKNPTMLELHLESGRGTSPTATNKRVMRLEAWGVVRILEGRPMRVELV